MEGWSPICFIQHQDALVAHRRHKMKLSISKIFLVTVLGLVLSQVGVAASHINLSSDPSDYTDSSRFMKMCVEFNSELPNAENVCQSVQSLYFSQK